MGCWLALRCFHRRKATRPSISTDLTHETSPPFRAVALATAAAQWKAPNQSGQIVEDFLFFCASLHLAVGVWLARDSGNARAADGVGIGDSEWKKQGGNSRFLMEACK